MKSNLLLSGLIGMTLVLCAGNAQSEDTPLKNWFNDPFFQVRNGIPNCPVPLGPLMSDAQRKQEAHYRVERGTSCWLEGKCTQPNAYWYDAPLANAIQQQFSQTPLFADTSLWVIVQRRFAIVQGCIANEQQAGEIEAMIRQIPEVDRILMDVMQGNQGKVPYPLAAPQ